MIDQNVDKINWGKSCILLTRVSTSSQDNTAQELDLIEYAKREGYDNLHIIQTTESGFKKIKSKQGFKIVQDYIENNPDCKTVFCTEISRIGRTNLVLSHVEDYFTQNKIQVYIKDINFKLFNEYGQIPFGNTIVFSLFGRLAESEMKQKQERFIRSKAKNFSEGYSIGGKELFGYERFLD